MSVYLLLNKVHSLIRSIKELFGLLPLKYWSMLQEENWSLKLPISWALESMLPYVAKGLSMIRGNFMEKQETVLHCLGEPRNTSKSLLKADRMGRVTEGQGRMEGRKNVSMKHEGWQLQKLKEMTPPAASADRGLRTTCSVRPSIDLWHPDP